MSGKPEIRYAILEFREDGDRMIVSGTAARYGEFAPIGRYFNERIQRGAFGSIGEIVANVQHDRRVALARNIPSGGLSFQDSESELRVSLELPPTTAGRDAGILVQRGVLRGFSVEMIGVRDSWEGENRTIEKATLGGIGLVDDPTGYAEGDLQVAMRSKPKPKPEALQWRLR